MNPDQSSLTPDDVRLVMETLPPVVRQYLAEGRYSLVTKNLMFKYNLRVDQGGVLEREIMLLLMGVETPDEFADSLIKDAGLKEETINTLLEDINTQIFIPLRDAERRREALPQIVKPKPTLQMPPAQPTAPQVATPIMQMPSMYTPPPQSPRYPHQQTSEPSITFTRSTNKPVPPPSPASAPKSPTPTGPEIKDAAHMLEDHEEPHIEFHHDAPQSSGVIQMPAVPNVERNVPPPNLPGASLPVAAPQQSVAEPKIVAPSPNRPYGADPYREPLE